MSDQRERRRGHRAQCRGCGWHGFVLFYIWFLEQIVGVGKYSNMSVTFGKSEGVASGISIFRFVIVSCVVKS